MILTDLREKLKWSDETYNAFNNDIESVLHWLPALRRTDLEWEYHDKAHNPEKLQEVGPSRYYRDQLSRTLNALQDMEPPAEWELILQMLPRLDPEFKGPVYLHTPAYSDAVAHINLLKDALASAINSFSSGVATERVVRNRKQKSFLCLDLILAIIMRHDPRLNDKNKSYHSSPLHRLVCSVQRHAAAYELDRADCYKGGPVFGDDAEKNLVKIIKARIENGFEIDVDYWLSRPS